MRNPPGVAAELRRSLVELEKQFKDVQDIEFTIEDGRLWILQSRAAKRTARAALRIAVDLVHEGLISEQEGLERVKELDLEALSIARSRAARRRRCEGSEPLAAWRSGLLLSMPPRPNGWRRMAIQSS